MSDYIHGYKARPQIPKTLGILNIIFGFILLMFGLCGVVANLSLPAIQEFTKTAQAKFDAEIARQDKELEAKEKAATDPAVRDQFRADREKLKSAPRPQMEQMNFDSMKDPTVRAFTWFNMLGSMLIYVAMIVTGFGLVGLHEWARVAAIRLAAIGLIFTWVGTGASIALVMPEQAKANQKRIASLEAAEKDGKGNPNSAMELQMLRIMGDLMPAFAIGGAIVGSVYPIISLLLLRTLGAKEACAVRELGSEEFADEQS